MSVSFDFAPDLPVPVKKWGGFPKYNFIGGHNDAERVPVDALIAAATSVLKREGTSLATYGLNSGPLGYRPLREFLVRKLKWHAGIACEADDILITSGSLQGLDLVNSLLLSAGDTVLVEQDCYSGSLSRLGRRGVNVVGIPLDSRWVAPRFAWQRPGRSQAPRHPTQVSSIPSRPCKIRPGRS